MTDLRKAAIELLKSAPDHITEHWPELDEVCKALAQPEQSSSMDEWRSMVVVNLLPCCPNLSKHELRELAAHFESRLPVAQPGQEPVDRETLIECIAGSISKHMTVKLYPSEVLAAAEYIVDNYAAPPSKQEPVAWMFEEYAESSKGYMRWFKCIATQKPQGISEIYRNTTPLFTAPPSKEWVSLTDEEVWEAYEKGMYEDMWVARAIEAALRSKNEHTKLI